MKHERLEEPRNYMEYLAKMVSRKYDRKELIMESACLSRRAKTNLDKLRTKFVTEKA